MDSSSDSEPESDDEQFYNDVMINNPSSAESFDEDFCDTESLADSIDENPMLDVLTEEEVFLGRQYLFSD